MQNDNETKIQKDNNNLLKPIKVNSLEIIDIKKNQVDFSSKKSIHS